MKATILQWAVLPVFAMALPVMVCWLVVRIGAWLVYRRSGTSSDAGNMITLPALFRGRVGPFKRSVGPAAPCILPHSRAADSGRRTANPGFWVDDSMPVTPGFGQGRAVLGRHGRQSDSLPDTRQNSQS